MAHETTIGIRFSNMMHLRPVDWVPVLSVGLMPLVATFVHKGAVIVLAVLGVHAFYSAISRHALGEIFSPKLFMLAGGGAAWLLVASFISPDTAGGVKKIVQICLLAGLFFPAAWFIREASSDEKKTIVGALAVGTLAALALQVCGYLAIAIFDQQLIEIERENELTVLYPGFIVVALFLPGLFGYLHRAGRSFLMWGAAATALALSVAIDFTSATMLIVFTIATFVLFRRDPWQMPRILALALIVITITLPVSMPLVLDRVAVVFVENQTSTNAPVSIEPAPGSIEHRYRIWRFAADRAVEKPFLGWGFNASRMLPGGHQLMADGAELLPLHPHNAVLQVWLELGVPGLLLLCIVLWRTYMPPGWHDFKRRELLIRTQTVTVIFIAASVTFGIWQSWWLATIALVIASTSLWHERNES